MNLIAVYGSLKKGECNHSFLASCEFVGEFLTDPEFTMYNVSSLYPAVIHEGTTAIACEVYKLKDIYTYQMICALEGYNGYRNDIKNYFEPLDISTPFGAAQMFVVTKKLNRPVLQSGKW